VFARPVTVSQTDRVNVERILFTCDGYRVELREPLSLRAYLEVCELLYGLEAGYTWSRDRSRLLLRGGPECLRWAQEHLCPWVPFTATMTIEPADDNGSCISLYICGEPGPDVLAAVAAALRRELGLQAEVETPERGYRLRVVDSYLLDRSSEAWAGWFERAGVAVTLL
jgi:hypothetical protein